MRRAMQFGGCGSLCRAWLRLGSDFFKASGARPLGRRDFVKRHCHSVFAMFLVAVMLISGCGAAPSGGRAESAAAPAGQPVAAAPASSVAGAPGGVDDVPGGAQAGGYEAPPFRDAVFHEGAAACGSGVEIDLSAVAQGYVAVRAQSDKRLKCQIVFGDTKYNYDLPGDNTPIICPLQSGDGSYTVRIMQNTTENKYAEIFSAGAQVTMGSELEPFLRPNQRSNYTQDSRCVAEAARMAESAADAAGLVSAVYEYIAENIDYDYDKAQWVVDNSVKGYLPDPDDTLSSGKGICYDYASLAAAMLRSQGIPTKLIIGYVQSGSSEVYHAWNMIWLEETGWITVEIKAPAHAWQRIDLTFAAAGQSEFAGGGTGYTDKEVY